MQHRGITAFLTELGEGKLLGPGPDSAWQRSLQQQAWALHAAQVMIMLFIVLFQTETNFVYLWEGYEATTIKALKTERDQLRSEAPPVVPSFAQASKRQHRDCARPPSLSIPGLRRNLDSDTRVHSSGLRTVQLADGLAVRGH